MYWRHFECPALASVKQQCHPECGWSTLTLSSEHPLCHEALNQTIICVFPDTCIYTHTAGFGLIGWPDSCLLKRKCVGFLLMTSSPAQPVQIVISNSFLFIHHGGVFPKLRKRRGLVRGWVEVLQLIKSGTHRAETKVYNLMAKLTEPQWWCYKDQNKANGQTLKHRDQHSSGAVILHT